MIKVAVIVITKKDRKKYLDQLLDIIDQHNVDVLVYPSVDSKEDLAKEYARIVEEDIDSKYTHVSFIDDDDLVCKNFYQALIDNIANASAISAQQIQFKKVSEIEYILGNNTFRFVTNLYSYLDFHGPSLISIEKIKPYLSEFEKCKLDEKRFIIKLLQKNNHDTIMGRGIGSFWRVRDNQGKYYE